MKLSVIIPAYNESGSISETIQKLFIRLQDNNIENEIVAINDNSSDDTLHCLNDLRKEVPTLVVYTNQGPNGFGYAVRYGLDRFTGDCVAIMMADQSDDPDDLVKFYNKMVSEKVDCVFGSRFIKGGETVGYPKLKKIINRIANLIIRVAFRINYNDTTNAFKLYRRETIEGLRPFLAPHFNLTIELPLKAIVRGYSYGVVPNRWANRKSGESKLKIKEMGSRYFFILLYCLIEKFFSQGDFHKVNQSSVRK